LAPCNFFPRLKSTLKGKQFQDVAETQVNTTWQLQAIPKQAYQTRIEKWKDRWNFCIQSGGTILLKINQAPVSFIPVFELGRWLISFIL
jgi:hypothetical protein